MTDLTIIFPESFGRFSRKLNSGAEISFPLNRRRSIKDIVESLGVPHTEIGRILENGKPVDFGFIPRGKSRITLHPVPSPFDVTQPTLLRPRPLDALRFIVDVNVGKLASLMRMVGLDAAFSPHYMDDEIAERAVSENRVVLSKDIGLLKRRQIEYGRYVRAIHPDEQLREMMGFFRIRKPAGAFSRCLRCNTKLVPVDKPKIEHRLEPNTKKYYHRFMLCPICNRLFWKGSHHEHMGNRLRRMGVSI